MLYELLKESAIAFMLAMVVGTIFTWTTKGLSPPLYFFAGSLTYLLIFGGMVTWRAIMFSRSREGKNGEKDD